MSDYEQRTWTEFYNSGMLWFVNRILHVFGWVIVAEQETDTVGNIVRVWPARTKKILGFTPEQDEERRRWFLANVREEEK